MKRKYIPLLITFSILTTIGRGQNPIEKGQTQINAGVGLSTYGLPVYVGLDYGIHEDITIGGEFSFRTYNDNIWGTRYNHSVIGISGNANYHFNNLLEITPEYDLYAGLNVGFYIWNSPSAYHGSRTSGLGLGLQIGGRYYFNDKFGVNLELGGGTVSGAKIGISIKL